MPGGGEAAARGRGADRGRQGADGGAALVGLPCVDAHRGAGPLHAGVSVTVGAGLAVRGNNGDGWPMLVIDEMGEGVVGVGASAGGVGAHVRDVVNVLGRRELRRVDSSRMGWTI